MTNFLLRPSWGAPANVHSISTLRSGGVSLGHFASLNLGDHVGDEPAAVAANRHSLRQDAALPNEPQWLRQVHGVHVVTAQPQAPAVPPAADGIVTNAPDVVCAIMTADCLPVLFCTADGGAVAAAHAGWRGLAAGVLENTVQRLRSVAGSNAQILAWFGPAISAAHFEVGDEVLAAFTQAEASAAQHFARNERGRWQADLNGVARQRLHAMGVTQISGGEHCTYADESRFFSHRRDVQHRGAAATGRMATLIWRSQ